MVLEIRNAREREDLFGNVRCIARIVPFGSDELRERVGFDAWVDEFFPGLGTTWEGYPCELSGYFGFGLLRGIDDREKDQLHIFADGVECLSLILFALRIDPGRLTWRIDLDPLDGGDWETVRQDDNGNLFVLDRFAERHSAERCAALWSRMFGDHKQTALVRRRGADGTA
ncbi:MAG: hypothetical protein ACR2PM_21145 [Hyphomicrobiales bacterium]